jgi:UPF0755 protein
MRFLRRLGCLALLAALAAGFLAFRLFAPYGTFPTPVYLDIPHGASSEAIAGLLTRAGVVRSRWDFLLARIGERRVLQAGEYRFDHAASPLEVFDRIARGDVFFLSLTVPEGQNMFDVAQSAGALGLFSADAFLAAARNPAPIRDLDPQAPTLEGYLFPSTYRLNNHSTPLSVCHAMTDRFREHWRALTATASPGATVHDVTTLASLVEREAKLPEERPRIAAVFDNRLRDGMKLDCDPTTIYAAILDGRYRGTIYRSDLDSDNAYNTYRHTGLPPGPIANPGLDSLRAAMRPAQTDALYFVAKPDGSGAHEFSNTLEKHNAATARYRKGLK